MKRLVQFIAVTVAILALNACEQHPKSDLATLEKEAEHEGGPGHGEQISATKPSQEIHAGVPAKEAPRFFPARQ
jgi:hypothetical protein